MTTPNLHALGLGVAANLAGLGVLATLYPAWTAHDIFGVPQGTGGDSLGVASMTRLMAARDFTIAAAIVSYGLNDRDKAMGELILLTLIFCGADVIVTWQYGNLWTALGMSVVGSIWGTIGWRLISENDT